MLDFLGSPRDTFARKRANGCFAALGAQTWLGGSFPGRLGGGAAQSSQQGRRGDRWAAAYQLECACGVRVDAGRRGYFGARRRGATSAILAQLHSRKTHSRHAQARRYVCHCLPRATHASLGAQSLVAGGVGCLHPGSRWEEWNLEPQDLSQAGWLNGKVFAPSAATCAGGAGAVLDCFVASEAIAHLVQQVEVVDNSQSPGTKTADLELAWLEWLRAAEAAWCRIHDLFEPSVGLSW